MRGGGVELRWVQWDRCIVQYIAVQPRWSATIEEVGFAYKYTRLIEKRIDLVAIISSNWERRDRLLVETQSGAIKAKFHVAVEHSPTHTSQR